MSHGLNHDEVYAEFRQRCRSARPSDGKLYRCVACEECQGRGEHNRPGCPEPWMVDCWACHGQGYCFVEDSASRDCAPVHTEYLGDIDGFEILIGNDPYYAKAINAHLDIYCDQASHQIVGVLIKGVSRLRESTK